MKRRLLAVCVALVVTVGAVVTAAGQDGLVAGGLTALPSATLGPDLLINGGFEVLNGSLPVGWTGGTGWGIDQLVTHAGSYAYQRTGNAPTAWQTIQLTKGVYRLSGWVKTDDIGLGNAGIRLQVDFRPAVQEWLTTQVIRGTTDWTHYEIKNIIVPEDRVVRIKLENYAGATGTAWFDDVKLEEQLPQAVDVFLLYPNYRGMLFDDQPLTMKFDVSVTPPANDFGKYRVSGTLTDETSGEILATQDYAAAPNFVATLDGSAMQSGRAYLATFGLVDLADGRVVSAYPAYRVSKAPAAARQAMNVAFDAKNRILIKGQPRFVLGLYDSGGGYSTADSFWENQLWSPAGSRRMEGLPVNLYLNYWMGAAPAEAMKALMANLQKRGVMYLQTGNCFDRSPAGPSFQINASDAYVQDIGAHPGSAGYYTADECRSELIPGVFDQYVRLRQLDPDSITFAALFGQSDLVLWRDAVDVLATDPYPMYAAEPASGYNHKQVADWTARTRDVVKDARPFMTVLQFFKFTSLGRWPTLTEMRSHAYMAIVEGAKGLWWWSEGNGSGALASICSDWCPERTAHMDDLRALVTELAGLEPVLIADDVPEALTGNSNSTAIRTKVKLVDGKGYVFAYNYTNAAVDVTFTWNTAPAQVSVSAEGRTISPNGASFSDTFGPYEAHVYIVDSGAGSGPPLTALSVSAVVTSSGAPVTVTLTGGLGGASDWLGFAPAGSPDTTYLEWTYVGAGVSTTTWTVTMPDTPGGYEFRLFLNDGFSRAATSPTVRVE